MKKLLSLLMVMICAIGTSAQQGWTARTGQSQDRTVVIADFSVTNGASVYEGNWRIGVFVGDECRLVTQDNATDVLTSVNNQQFLMLEVPGNFDAENDEGKEIVIKVSSSMGDVYTLKPDQTLTWQPQTTYGVGSGPRVQLALTLPAEVTLSGFRIDAGNSVDLTNFLNVSPANAQIPENLIWYVGNNYYQPGDYGQFATISGSTLTAVKPNLSEGENLPIPYGFVINAGNYMPLLVNGNPVENASFYIEQPATTLTIVTGEYSVIINNAEELTMFMKNNANVLAYSTNPTEITEQVKWQFDATYIQAGQDSWKPIKGGTTSIQPYIERADGNLYPDGNKGILLNIIVPVENAYFNWPNDPQTQQQITFKCNVGDENILQHLDQYVRILPLDATDRTYTITDISSYGSPQELGYRPVLYVNSDNTIEALAAGSAELLIQPNGIGGEDLAFTVFVEVDDPLKEVSFTEDPLTFDSATNTLETITSGIRRNIIWQDEYKTLQFGTLSVAGVLTGSGEFSPNGPMLTLNNTEIPKGESTITVRLGWNDYSQYDGTEESIAQQWNAGQSFKVIITMGLDHFTITVTPSSDDPTRGTITLTPVPADADFDWADYADILTVRSDNYDSSWHTIDIKAGGEGIYTYVALLPGEFAANCDPDEEDVFFEVPYRVSFANGWQWKSNPYGDMMSNKNLYSYFGDDLAEARTYDKLLYNDTEWGYWGSLYDSQEIAIEQAQMYKVKMNAAHETFLYNGNSAEWNEFNVAKGWNWIGSPYFYKRTLDRITTPVDGMIVVGKTGSAEYDYNSNTWSGDLKAIEPGQGYYVYMPAETETGTIILECEVFGHMNQSDDGGAGARAARQSVWSYDQSRFANNLTVVAEVSDLDNPEEYTIGAFVDGECRGEGIFEDGRAFITVHTDGGEQVALRLHNELTGEYTDIDQTISTTAMRLGSLKAPVQLTAQGVVTGISSVESAQQQTERFDLNGRTVKGNHKGMTIVRQADGSVRKVVR